jgi:hypothetical protein
MPGTVNTTNMHFVIKLVFPQNGEIHVNILVETGRLQNSATALENGLCLLNDYVSCRCWMTTSSGDGRASAEH